MLIYRRSEGAACNPSLAEILMDRDRRRIFLEEKGKWWK
jgi:hypothetical protein